MVRYSVSTLLREKKWNIKLLVSSEARHAHALPTTLTSTTTTDSMIIIIIVIYTL